jgi:hypothetical protein
MWDFIWKRYIVFVAAFYILALYKSNGDIVVLLSGLIVIAIGGFSEAKRDTVNKKKQRPDEKAEAQNHEGQ